MTATAITLAYRPRGGSSWVDIDPQSAHGARLLHALGLQVAAEIHPTEERELMTTTAIRRENITAVGAPKGATSKERFAFALRLRERAVLMANGLLAKPLALVRKMVHALHLDTAWGWVKSGLAWMRDKLSWAGGLLGTTGMLGLGMVALSTGHGRTATSYALKPVGWAVRGLGWGLNTIKSGLRHLGRPGNWVADRIEGTENWVATQAVSLYKAADKRIGKYLQVGSTPMRLARLGGVLLLAQRAITAFALPMPVTYLIAAATAFWGVYDVVDLGIKVGEKRGWLEVRQDKATGAKKATAHASATVTTPGAQAAAHRGGSHQGRRGN